MKIAECLKWRYDSSNTVQPSVGGETVKRFIIPFLVFSSDSYAWNGTGHKAIALVAYQHLTPTAKQRVDEILAKHPDYMKWSVGVSAADRGPRRVPGRFGVAGRDP